MSPVTRLVEVRQNVFKQNDLIARSLRDRFQRAGVFVLSLVSSPGAGKTALLEGVLTRLRQRYRVARGANQGVEIRCVSFVQRHVQGRLRILIQAVTNVAHDADHAIMRRWIGTETNSLADGILIRPESSGHGLTDYHRAVPWMLLVHAIVVLLR